MNKKTKIIITLSVIIVLSGILFLIYSRNRNGPGPSGPTGPDDPTGPTGPTGPDDPTGPTGPTGPDDPTGPDVPTGPTGPDDPTGPTGPDDPTGPTGPDDPTGPTGPIEPAKPVILGIGNGYYPDLNNIAYSEDGINWVGQASDMLVQANGGCWFNKAGLWIVVGADNQGKHNIITSPDGLNWTFGGSGGFGNFGAWDADANEDMCIAVGYGPHMNYTTDGINWLPINNIIFDLSCSCIVWRGLWLASGTGGTHCIGYSEDGITWTPTGDGLFTNALKIEYNGKLWVVVGTGANSLAYSTDGKIWTGLGTDIFTSATCIAWNGRMWLALGTGPNNIAYSYDGLSWTGLPDIGFKPTALAWFNEMWVVIGEDRDLKNNRKIGNSPDGINWEINESTILQIGRSLITNQ